MLDVRVRCVAVCLLLVTLGQVAPGIGYAAGGVPAFDHIFIVVLENHTYSAVIGNTTEAPYVNQLANRYGSAANYVGVAHPSLPNYLALIGGDTFGVATDCTACYLPASNLITDRIVPGTIRFQFRSPPPKKLPQRVTQTGSW